MTGYTPRGPTLAPTPVNVPCGPTREWDPFRQGTQCGRDLKREDTLSIFPATDDQLSQSARQGQGQGMS